MANKIILKKSSVPSKVPLQQDLDYGELAINYADGLLYYKNSLNQVIPLNTGGSGGNASVSIGINPPSSPGVGDLWWDSSESNLYIYYQDQDSAQWVPATIGNFVDSGGSSASGVTSVNGQDGIVTLTSTDIAEGSNLYYTNARFDTRLALKTTSNLAEGTNLYYTTSRANAAIDARVTKDYVEALGIETVTSLLDLNITDGTSGQVLTTDGAGNFSFGDAGGSSTNFSSVSQSIVPSANEVHDLGSATNRWRDLYLSGSTINLGGASIKADADSGAIAFIPQPTIENPNPSGMVVSPTGGITVVSTVGGQVSSGDIADAAASPTAAPVPIDITTTPPTNGQALVWDSANSKFIPDDISGGSGGVTTGKAIAMAIVFGG